MANFSLSISRGTDESNVHGTGSNITAGTLAPNAGDLEVRMTDANGITLKDFYKLVMVLWRYVRVPGNNTFFAN